MLFQMYLLNKLKIVHVQFSQRPQIKLFPYIQRAGDCLQFIKDRISCLCCQRKDLKEELNTQHMHSVISNAQRSAQTQASVTVHPHCSLPSKQLSEKEKVLRLWNHRQVFPIYSDLGDLTHGQNAEAD